MDMIVLGCSGSVEGPDSPASGYHLRSAGGTEVLLDLGPGVLSAMQRHPDLNPAACHVVFSHLHADHCLDFPSLLVWRRFHPHRNAAQHHELIGPSITATHLGRAGADHPDHPDDFSDTFHLHHHHTKNPKGTFDPETWPHHRIGDLRIYSAPAVHPTEGYITRIQADSGAALVYTGDTAATPELARISHGADVLLCEATWGENGAGYPEGMHLSGEEAGQAARDAQVGKLILTHIPPWGDVPGTLRGAARFYPGPIAVAAPNMKVRVSRPLQ